MDDIIQAIKDTATSDDHWVGDKVKRKHLDKFKDELKKGSLTSDDCQTFILVAIDNWDKTIVGEFVCLLLDRKKPIDWQQCGDFAEKMLNRIVQKADKLQSEDKTEMKMGNFVMKFVKMLKSSKHLPRMIPHLFELFRKGIECISQEQRAIHAVAWAVSLEMPWKEYLELWKQGVELICKAVHENPTICNGDRLLLLMHSSNSLFEVSINNYKRAKDILPEVTDLVHFLKDAEWKSEDDPDNHTVAYEILKTLLDFYLYGNHRSNDILKPNMDVIKELWECGDETLEGKADNIMTSIAGNAELLGDDAVVIIDKYLSGEDLSLISSFVELYKDKPDLFHDKIDELVQSIDVKADWMIGSGLSLFWEMAKVKPEIFTASHVATIAKCLDNTSFAILAVLTLNPIAEKHPDCVLPYDEKLMDVMKLLGSIGSPVSTILVSLARFNKERAKDYLLLIWDTIDASDTVTQMSYFWSFRQIGEMIPHVLQEHKPRLLEMKEVPALKDKVQDILDLIEGRSLEQLSHQVAEHKDGMDNLDERVTSTEQNVSSLDNDVKEAQHDVRDVKNDAITQEARLDDLEQVVEDTTEKVEEIDRKTLSHAPSWSRDVAKLLNSESEHDWRLLATILNYTTEDVKNWATQPDPCLSLLDEWFATHKTREATYAILKTVQEMDRNDAAMIVENSLKNVDGIIDEDPPELVDPPPIFISYQWAHQPEVKLLNRHLEMAGFKAWMDVGQMGGGDKLFAKIDEGIRAAKVIICCVSEKYAQSPNCNREVNLSVTLGKPIIPLLMEKLSWPPPGTMGPIFSEYLFIRFFQRDVEKTKNDKYWPLSKFQELLMQLRYNVVPDDSIITDEYREWFHPPEEIIIIKSKDPKAQCKKSATNAITVDMPSSTSPDVFISYQWGKQAQIKALYSRLTDLGISCWLDILQMGGGDSLYDKIDRGVRGCKVVVSCVTTKYSLSANCRREVSLADALKKPIVPLLVEGISWPPEGPMALVFTQLLYINFSKPDVQNHWMCPEFDELLGKLGEHVSITAQENKEHNLDRKSQDKESLNNGQINLDDNKQSEEIELDKPNSTPVTERKTVSATPSTPAAQKKSSSCDIL